MDTTSVEIPTELLAAAKLKPEDVKVELAMELFRQGRLTTTQAHALVGDDPRLEELFLKKDRSGQLDMAAFISWAAHDFKSPLNAIIGFTKVVLKGIDGPVNELQTTDLTSAHSNGLRMLALTNNLIDMARLNNGDLKIEITTGDLFQTLTDAANRWKSQNSSKELHTEINFSSPVFDFDPMRLRQVINGLLTYAGNHVAEGGKLTLSAWDDAGSILVEISSSGEKARDKFEMELTMQSFICQGLVALHGGSLKLGSDNGTGMTVSFALPKN
jgi:signal transduction histidine kinase